MPAKKQVAKKDAKEAPKKTEAEEKEAKEKEAKEKAKELDISRRNREIAGVIFIALGIFLFFARGGATTSIAKFWFDFLDGMFGQAAFMMPIISISYGIYIIAFANKPNFNKKSFLVLGLLISILSIGHLSYLKGLDDNYLSFLIRSYFYGNDHRKGMGILGAIFSYPINAIFGNIGAYIFFIASTLIDIICLTNISIRDMSEKVSIKLKENVTTIKEVTVKKIQEHKEFREAEKEFYNFADPLDNQDVYKRKPKENKFRNIFDFEMGNKANEQMEEEEIKEKPKKKSRWSDMLPFTENSKPTATSLNYGDSETGKQFVEPVDPFRPFVKKQDEKKQDEPIEIEDDQQDNLFESGMKTQNNIVDFEKFLPPKKTNSFSKGNSFIIEDVPDDNVNDNQDILFQEFLQTKDKDTAKQEQETAGGEALVLAMNKDGDRYIPPSVSFLKHVAKPKEKEEDPKLKAIRLEETLKSFGIMATVINVTQGPVVTRYELQPAPGVRVNRITNLADDIALNLAAPTVRIEAPIPGKAAIGIEIPNKVLMPVSLREIIDSNEFKGDKSFTTVALGKDISGNVMLADIAKMPHLLIAGSTGSGKSVCINCIICSFLYHSTPEDIKLIMVDPKVVELAAFSNIPHLLIPVVTDPKEAASALKWAVKEMVDRYNNFANVGARDLARYNEISMANGAKKTPQIVVIVDELADLMMVAPDDVEDAICRIAQMGRAAGIHLIVATQRPSADVITGIIKANIPSRIAFAVASATDSRIILDSMGAEKLLGKGDMLFSPIGASQPIRVQGALVTDPEVEKIKEHFSANQITPNFDESIQDGIANTQIAATKNSSDPDQDELLPKAVEILMQTGQASISMLQRRMRIGYSRAARLIDTMEGMGIVGAHEGPKSRKLLITRAEYEQIFGFPPEIPDLGT